MRAFPCVLLLLALANGAQAQYLFVIPTQSKSPASDDDSRALHLVVHNANPAALGARQLGVAEPVAGADRLEFTLDAYPQLPAPPGLDARAASFVIDYDQPSVRRVHTRLIAEYGTAPTRRQLARFVDRWIEDKNMEQGFDIASEVASRRAGDCTEHAVLLTALARATGRQARVVIGLALVAADGRYQAMGHAWSEIREGDRWLIADAALIGRKVRYLPYGVLGNEGPGFTFGMAQLTMNGITRLEVL